MADSIIGTSVPRIDGVDKVTGRAVYSGDIKLANMLCAAVARSPFPCAKIGAIDAESLRQRRGVAAVLTAEDVPPALYGPAIDDQPVLARDEARYQGEPVAVVIAASRDEAEAGAADLEVDWNPLPALTTVDEALAADAWAVHAGRAGARVPWLERQGLSSVNCCHSFVREHGDVDRALESATHVFEHEFEVPAVQAYPLERYECIALWDGSELTVWSATQSAFVVRRDLARIFGLRLNQVHVTAPLVGGGFGAKLYSKVEPIAAACAFAARGRPVKLSLSADESAATLTRHAAKVRLTTGVSADGIIVARDCLSILNNGVYADAGPRVADKAGFRAPGPYRIGNVRSRSCTVYTNLPPNGAYRGFGAPQVVWAYETQADIIAGQLGINPLEFRERNLLHRGEYFSPDDSPLDCDIPASLAIMKQRLGQPSDDRSSPSPSIRVGEGHAVGLKDGGGQRTASNAEVRLDEDGSVAVLVGSSEIGQGVLTAFAQLVADELQLDVDTVRTQTPDTRRAPYDSGTNASRTVTLVGSAVVMAARQVREELIAAFRDRHALPPDAEVTLQASTLSAGPLSESVADAISAASLFRGGQIVGTGHYRTHATDGVLGARTAFWEPGIAGARVEVDEETGAVDITRFVSILDVGHAINPQLCRGQDVGAAVMAIGPAMSETLEFVGGQLVNASLVDYRLPSTVDAPRHFESVLVENDDGPGPHGARGIGEGGLLAVAPALGNAIAAATGVRITTLPMTPEVVWRALRDASSGQEAASESARVSVTGQPLGEGEEA